MVEPVVQLDAELARCRAVRTISLGSPARLSANVGYLRVPNPQGSVDVCDSENRLVRELRWVRTPVSHDSRNLPGDGRGGPASDGEKE